MREYKIIALSASCAFLFVAGALTSNLQLYWMAATIFALMLGAYWVARTSLKNVVAERAIPHEAWEGEPVQVRATVWADNKLPKSWLLIKEKVGDGIRRDGPEFVPITMESERSECDYAFTASRRGLYKIGPLEAIGTDPIGLYWTSAVVSPQTEVLILPKPVPIPGWDWNRRGGGGGFETDRAKQKGPGIEMHGAREYAPGDPLRRIHWRATARTNRLFVRDFESGRMNRQVIAIELPNEQNLDRHDRIEQGIRHAAWLALESIARGLPVTIVAPGWHGIDIKIPTDPGAPRQALASLAQAESSSGESLAAYLQRLAPEWGSVVSLVALSSSTDIELERVANVYRRMGFMADIVQVSLQDVNEPMIRQTQREASHVLGATTVS